jgi:hypothetical protein
MNFLVSDSFTNTHTLSSSTSLLEQSEKENEKKTFTLNNFAKHTLVKAFKMSTAAENGESEKNEVVVENCLIE